MKYIILVLLKVVLILFFLVFALLLMTIIGLRFTLFCLFLIAANNIWAYKPKTYKVQNEVVDYYNLFDIATSFSDVELKSSFNDLLNDLDNNSNINFETKLVLTRKLQDAFDILNNPETRAEYEQRYFAYTQEVELIEQKNREKKVGLFMDIKGMLTIEKEKMSDIKSILTKGIIIAVIIDIVILTSNS